MNPRFLPAIVLATGCISNAPLVETSFAPVAVSGHVRVHIAADDASVRVVAADVTDVEMRAGSRGYDVGRDLDLGIAPRGDQVDITARTRGNFHFDLTEHSLHIEVRVPRDADLEISTGDGDVELEALAGTVDVGTGDGAVSLRGGRGDIRLHTGDGSVTGRGLDGSVEVSTGDGGVDIAGRFDVLIASTSDGKLIASAAAGSRMIQPWHLESQDGDVMLGVSRDLAAHIDASTGDGRVRSSIPLSVVDSSRAVGDVNGGGPSIILRTGDGSIQLDQL